MNIFTLIKKTSHGFEMLGCFDDPTRCAEILEEFFSKFMLSSSENFSIFEHELNSQEATKVTLIRCEAHFNSFIVELFKRKKFKSEKDPRIFKPTQQAPIIKTKEPTEMKGLIPKGFPESSFSFNLKHPEEKEEVSVIFGSPEKGVKDKDGNIFIPA